MKDELWNEIKAVVVDGDMTPDARNIAILAIDELRSQFTDYEALIALQHRRTVDADRIYQEAHGWPDTKFPDLGKLVGWLLEQYVKALEQSEYIQTHGLTEIEVNALRAKNERLREALEAMDTKLEVESSFEEKGEKYIAFYRVPAGPWHKVLGLIRG